MTTVQQKAAPAVPAHVPAELVWPHSLAAFMQQGDDPFLTGAQLHAGPDIVWAYDASVGQPGWVVTRMAMMQEAFHDPEHFTSERQGLAMLGVSWRLNPLEFDPPLQQVYRRILNPYFTPKAMSALDHAVEQTCDTLMDSFASSGRCEFIADFAERFPSYVFLDLMGMPHDMLHDFLQWERDLLRGENPMSRLGAMKAILAYLESYLADQKRSPGPELMKGLFEARMPDGRSLNDGEIMGMTYLLYIGGLDTVLSTLGWILRHLCLEPALQSRLREKPELLSKAVDEFLRAYSVAGPSRTVKQDYIFHGVEMKAGDTVLLPIYLGSRDPQAYENPDAIDLDRKERHMAFGNGVHTCLGRELARRELRTVISRFLARFEHIRIPEGETYAYHAGAVLGVDRLPLEWDLIA